jgi:hypothetical protein
VVFLSTTQEKRATCAEALGQGSQTPAERKRSMISKSERGYVAGDLLGFG